MKAKDGKRKNFYLSRDIAEKMEQFADRRGMTHTKVVEVALKKLLEEQPQGVGYAI